MDIVVWLRSLGLGQYEAAFRENEIDETVLSNLTAEDLKDLGVGIVGHRRKLLDAIAALRSDAGNKAPSADAATTPSAPSASTALSARVDPEDLSGSFRPIRSVWRRLFSVSEGSSPSTWATTRWSTSAIPRRAVRAVRAGLELVACG